MFKFKLQPVLTFRKRQEEEKMRELAVINGERVRTVQVIKEYTEQRRKTAKQITKISETSRDVNTIKLYEDFLVGRDSDIATKNKEMTEIAGRLSEKQKELIEFVKRRKALEVYRDRLKRNYEEDLKRKERIIDDESATNMWYREAL